MHALAICVTMWALWSPSGGGSFKRELYLYLPLVVGLGIMLLLCGSVPFLISFLKGRVRPALMTGLVPAGALAPSQPAQNNLMIGPYRALSTIGKGGMGTVFKAVDSQGRTFAIKMIGGTQLKGTALMREKRSANSRINLVREARLAAELRHPNIVEIVDIDQNKGVLYIVMELLEGMPLDVYARTHPIGAPEALRIVAQLCDALDCAHNHGIVHRDVKPANTFITAAGTVKVLDFGIALPPDAAQPLGLVAGTPFYMSPEQILGQDVDARADIWSAGVTLFQLLTTKTPFQGRTTNEVRSQILNRPTPKLPFAGPFADDLNGVLEKALAKPPEKRYASAREFANDLRSIMAKFAVNSADSPAFNSDARPAQAAPVRSTYKPIELGFRKPITNPVYLFTISKQRGLPFPEIPEFITSAVAVLAGLGVMFGFGVAALGVLAVVVLLCGALIFVGIVFRYFRPAPFYRCRSCYSRMRSVSVWSRPTWLAEQNSFCVPDCLAALGSGLWEEAVKLLWIHTSEEKSDRNYTLAFFECAKCADQRAYLTLSIRSDRGRELRGLREAYRFGTPANEHRYFATELYQQASATFAASAPSAAATLNTGADIHDRPTL
jgi:serine/threonine protein kinase